MCSGGMQDVRGTAGGRRESGASTHLGGPRPTDPIPLSVALHAQMLCCLKPISQHLKDSWSHLFPSCLCKGPNQEHHFCFFSPLPIKGITDSGAM